ncbi:MAG: DNA mismatch repair protein MutS, partial [Pseudomonadota bacterium]
MSRRGRKLTEEERDLWRKVAATTSRRAAQPVAPEADPASPRALTEGEPSPVPRVRILKPHGRPASQISLPPPQAPAPSGLDRATETRLRKGKKEPDGRLDLHGMTAQRAHAALNR